MRELILYLLLFILGILFNFGLNASYKQIGFLEILIEKNIEFVLSEQDRIFNLSFVMLLIEVNIILKISNYKKNVLMFNSFGCIKIIFLLPIKVVALYMQTFIIQVRILSF